MALCSGVTELVYKGGVDTEQAEEGVMIGKNLDLIMMNHIYGQTVDISLIRK